MSRMTKYLKQKCTYEKAKRDDSGNIVHDRYGEPQHEPAKVIKCRREESVQDIQTSTGSILKSSTRYFTDDGQVIQAGDRLDGKQVIKAHTYTNQFGATEGFESYV